MGTDITFKSMLVDLVMFKRLCPVKVAIAVAASKPLNVAVSQQMPFKLIGSRELAHAAEMTAKRALEPLRQIVN